MPVIQAAESVSAIVVDGGSSSVRIGWAGEDAPRCVLPTEYGYLPDPTDGVANASPEPATDAMDVDGAAPSPAQQRVKQFRDKLHTEQRRRFVGHAGANIYRPDMEIGTSFGPDGLLASASSLLAQLEYGIDTFLDADASQHPLLFTEPTWNSKEAREELTELAFEGLGVPGFYIANQPVMSSFTAGKASALVVDVGKNNMSVTPVVGGFAVKKGIVRQSLGGEQVNRALEHLILNPPPQAVRLNQLDPETGIVPRYLIKSKTIVEQGAAAHVWLHEDRLKHSTASFKRYQVDRVLDEFKFACGMVLDTKWDATAALQRPNRAFEFPDGSSDVFGIERLQAPEILFAPHLWQGVPSVLPESPRPLLGLAPLVLQSIAAVDADQRAAMFGHIVLVGGTTALPGFGDRLASEIGLQATLSGIGVPRVKIHNASQSAERRYAAWLGGSILATMDTFNGLWISRQEYDEHGASVVHTRCK